MCRARPKITITTMTCKKNNKESPRSFRTQRLYIDKIYEFLVKRANSWPTMESPSEPDRDPERPRKEKKKVFLDELYFGVMFFVDGLNPGRELTGGLSSALDSWWRAPGVPLDNSLVVPHFLEDIPTNTTSFLLGYMINISSAWSFSVDFQYTFKGNRG